MHRFKLPFACLLIAFVYSCEELDNFTIDTQEQAMIPKGTIAEVLVGDLGFGGLATFDLSSTDEYQNQGVTEDDVDSIKLSTLTLTISAPANGVDFTFLDTITFFVEAQGLPKVQIASAAGFSSGQKTINMTLDDVELKPYATMASMSITTEVSGHRPSEDTTVDAFVEFNVDVNVSDAVCGQ